MSTKTGLSHLCDFQFIVTDTFKRGVTMEKFTGINGSSLKKKWK